MSDEFPPFGQDLYDAEGNLMVTWDLVNHLRIEYNLEDETSTSRPFTEDEMSMLASVIAQAQLTANREALLEKTTLALNANRTYLNTPSGEKNLEAQIDALTRQINALFMLRLDDYSDISGT